MVRAQEGELNKRKPLQRCRGFFGFMIMIPCVYILQSKQLNRFYIGYSSNIGLRLEFHKHPDTRKFTSNAKDWILYYKIDCTTKSQALAIEAHIKRMKSKVYIDNLIKHPEITTKLLEKYRDC